jgi:hypothetical protein
MTRSMSYSRYFKIPTAMAAYRPASARQNTTFRDREPRAAELY